MSIRSLTDPAQQRRAEECKLRREARKRRIVARKMCRAMCDAVVEESKKAIEAERLLRKKQAEDAQQAAELLSQAIRLDVIATKLILEKNPFQVAVVREARRRRSTAKKLLQK